MGLNQNSAFLSNLVQVIFSITNFSPQITIYLYILCYLETQEERTNTSASNALRIISGNTNGFSLSTQIFDVGTSSSEKEAERMAPFHMKTHRDGQNLYITQWDHQRG